MARENDYDGELTSFFGIWPERVKASARRGPGLGALSIGGCVYPPLEGEGRLQSKRGGVTVYPLVQCPIERSPHPAAYSASLMRVYPPPPGEGRTYVCSGHDSAASRHVAPELCKSSALTNRARRRPSRRAQETPGARCTRSPCAKCRKHTGRHHRLTGTPGISCAMVLTVSFVLSPATGLCCRCRRRNAEALYPA
jgi:hypothetical protein